MSTDLGLEYIERLPEGGTSRGVPLVLLLHGWAMYKDYLFGLTQSWKSRATFVAAQAPIRMGPGANRWFDFERTPAAGPIIDDEEEERSLGRLRTFLERVVLAREPSSVYLLGHSQGGTMSLSLLLERPARVAGCAQVNGRFLTKRLHPSAPGALHGVSLFIGHGTENDIVPIDMGRWTRAQATERGADVAYREYAIGHEITAEALDDARAWLELQFVRKN